MTILGILFAYFAFVLPDGFQLIIMYYFDSLMPVYLVISPLFLSVGHNCN